MWWEIPVLVLGLPAVLQLQYAYANSAAAITDSGVVVGNTLQFNQITIDEFAGVPFAKAPTGDRRFKKPEPIERHCSPLNATKMPPSCPQFTTVITMSVPRSGQSEDCLYLNIWAPAPRTTGKRGVMFWLYGGSYAAGGNRLQLYNGSVLAATGDVVVVTVNYRLNALGFLYSGSDDAPGNVGLYDVLLALRWVRNNIASFGGDPGKITLFGQSAGGMTIGMLAVSPLAKGLYHRAIMQSGSPPNFQINNKTQNMVYSQRLAKAMNCANDTNTIFSNSAEVVSCLRKTKPYDLVKAAAYLKPNSLFLFVPQYGDDILPINAHQAVIDSDFYNTDILIGDTTAEGSHVLIRGMEDVFGKYGEKNTLFNKSFAKQILREKLTIQSPDPVIDYYMDSVSDDDYVGIRRQTFIAIGDDSLVCPNVFFAERYAEKGNNVFFYFFDHRPSNNMYAKWMGVTHFAEIQFVFGRPYINRMNYTQKELPLSDYMMSRWINFAKTGNPGNEWPQYSSKNARVLLIKSADSQKSVPQTPNCEVFRPYLGFEK